MDIFGFTIISKEEYLELMICKCDLEREERNRQTSRLPGEYNPKKDFLLITPPGTDSNKFIDMFQYVKLPYIFVQGSGLSGKQFLSYTSISEDEIKEELRKGNVRCPWCGSRYGMENHNCPKCGGMNEHLPD